MRHFLCLIAPWGCSFILPRWGTTYVDEVRVLEVRKWLIAIAAENDALEEFRSLGIQFISYQENIDTSSPLGQALFTIVSAVAQLERDLIRERVSAGVRNARACGKQLGRPRRIVNYDEIRQLRSEGASLRQIAAKMGMGYGTVRLRLQQCSNPQEVVE
jgi:DNA invertase Pin-like site-specific DNA recombinase